MKYILSNTHNSVLKKMTFSNTLTPPPALTRTTSAPQQESAHMEEKRENRSSGRDDALPAAKRRLTFENEDLEYGDGRQTTPG